MFRIGPHLTPAVFERLDLWANDAESNYQMQYKEHCAGIDALFVPVNDKIGLKFYHSEKKAKISWYIARILYHFGAAPKIADFRVVVHKGQKFYGFVTERCAVFGHAWRGRKRYDHRHRQIIGRLYSKVANTPFVVNDEHEYNFGINQKGQPVFIDVGHFQVRNSQGRTEYLR